MHNSLKLHFVYTTGRFPLPSTNTLWYVHCHDEDAGRPAMGWGSQRLGYRRGPCLTCLAEVVPRVVPSPGLHPTEQTQAEHRKAPMLSTSGLTVLGAIPGEGVSPDREGPGVSLHRDLPYHRLPSQPGHPLDSGQEQLREHSGRLAGSRDRHGDSFGKLLAQLGAAANLSLPPLALQQQLGAGSANPSPQISTRPISASPSAFLIKVIRYSCNT